MWWSGPKIAKDLVALISQKAKNERKPVNLVVDELLRPQLIEGTIYRCKNCGSAIATEDVLDTKKMGGICGTCKTFVSIFKS